jgi:hypothetical protein
MQAHRVLVGRDSLLVVPARPRKLAPKKVPSDVPPVEGNHPLEKSDGAIEEGRSLVLRRPVIEYRGDERLRKSYRRRGRPVIERVSLFEQSSRVAVGFGPLLAVHENAA